MRQFTAIFKIECPSTEGCSTKVYIGTPPPRLLLSIDQIACVCVRVPTLNTPRRWQFKYSKVYISLKNVCTRSAYEERPLKGVGADARVIVCDDHPKRQRAMNYWCYTAITSTFILTRMQGGHKTLFGAKPAYSRSNGNQNAAYLGDT